LATLQDDTDADIGVVNECDYGDDETAVDIETETTENGYKTEIETVVEVVLPYDEVNFRRLVNSDLVPDMPEFPLRPFAE
jgi:hypothetical protein